MACSYCSLTNNGGGIVYFNYMECEDSQWQYQVELEPGQTKYIWLYNGTLHYAPIYSTSIIQNCSQFPPVSASATPPVTPTMTPTPSITPSQTATPTVTPTNTATNTTTPTNTPTNSGTPTPTPTRARVAFLVCSAATSYQACGCSSGSNNVTLYGNNSNFDQCTQFFTGPTNLVPAGPGFISYNNAFTELDSSGNIVGGYDLCVTQTPTPTQSVTPTNTTTPTNTPTVTPTNTTTPTNTPTPTRSYYQYIVGTGATYVDACNNYTSSPLTVYGTLGGGVEPNLGETLYQTAGNPPTNPVGTGFYSTGTWVYGADGSGQIISSDTC